MKIEEGYKTLLINVISELIKYYGHQNELIDIYDTPIGHYHNISQIFLNDDNTLHIIEENNVYSIKHYTSSYSIDFFISLHQMLYEKFKKEE